jgi:recombination protein RecT
MTQTISNAVAQQDASPAALVKKYETDFTSALPTHINGKQWMSVALGALRRDPKVAEAAANNPGAFMSAMLTAARLGLEPGSEQYYLTPRKVKGRPEILGIVGYQGLVELIYRAGAVSSVIAEAVYNDDGFDYQPGRHERPVHTIDWDAGDRGALRLAYAYAIMKDGATSKVVVLNRADIARIKKSSQGADSEYSPWNTNESAMWLKSAVRQLAKWVPTSAEYRREQLRAAMDVAAETRHVTPNTQIQSVVAGDGEHIDLVTGEVTIDAELVDEWPAVAEAAK